jgi:hypothetical protein
VTSATPVLLLPYDRHSEPSALEPEDFVIALALSSLARHHCGFPRGAVCVHESGMTSTGVHVSRESAAHPGGFGKSDRLSADLREVRFAYRHFNERRVRAGPSPLRR